MIKTGKKKQQQIPILSLHLNKSLAQFSVKDVLEFKLSFR